MLLAVGEVPIDHVHDAAEERDADRVPFVLVCGGGEHLVECEGSLAHVEPADGPGRRLGPRGDLGHPEHRVDPEGLAEVLEQPFRIRVEIDRRRGRLADRGRLDLGLVDRTRGEIEVVVDLARHGELDRTRQLEAVAADQLGG